MTSSMISLAACNLDGVFGALGWQRTASCERPDVPESPERAESESESEDERARAVV